ncbi:MAG: M90 family metallopeptidase [Pseudomonadota bacterium]
MPFVLLILLVGLGYFAARRWARWQTRRRLIVSALSEDQRRLARAAVPLLEKMPRELQPRLEGKMRLFLHQVTFIGCDGLEVTEEMRLSIAAQACLLIANTDAWYDTLRTILIYPGAFKSMRAEQGAFVVTEREQVRLGESWARGPVVLSWAHSDEGAQNPEDGHNVVIHEFAHQLDNLSGQTDAAPILGRDQSFATWARVFIAAYDRHVARVHAGGATVLAAYGATSHVEYFAVAVEVFFERPRALQREEPEVYDQLSQLMRLDPAAWG